MSNWVWFAFGFGSCMILMTVVVAVIYMLTNREITKQLEDIDEYV